MKYMKKKSLLLLTLGSAIILGGCFSGEEETQDEANKSKFSKEEMLSILEDKTTTNDFKTTEEILSSSNNVIATFGKSGKILAGDVESKIINVENYDYVNYILNTMLKAAITGASIEPTKEEISALSNTLSSINKIENPTVNGLSKIVDSESNSLELVDIEKDVEWLWKRINVYKGVYQQGEDITEEELLTFYNSDAINKELYTSFENAKEEIKVKFYQNAIKNSSTEMTQKLIASDDFVFEDKFAFMEKVIDLYVSNDPDTLEKINALNMDFAFLKRESNSLPVFAYKDKTYTLLNVKEVALENAMGPALVDILFTEHILEKYSSAETETILFDAIANTSKVYYFTDNYKKEIRTFIALMNVAKEYDITNDEEVTAYFEGNKTAFLETLSGEMVKFEISAPIIYANFLLNEKSTELEQLKILLTSKINYSLRSELLDTEIKKYIQNTYSFK